MAAHTLTLIRLNPHHNAARADLRAADSLHKTLMRLIPERTGPTPRKDAGLLFRLDEDNTPTLLVQTAVHPDLSALPNGYGTCTTKDLTPMLNALTPGLPVHYRITANPVAHRMTEQVRNGTAKRGTLTALHGDDALAWWRRKATHAGLDIRTTTATRLRFRRDYTTPGPHHSLTRFDGTALITDPALLHTALTHGIGRGKAHGAGLLTLAPA
ncbi:CRISPR-associated protein, Cse3 family [Streptomyces sp. TLI_053]|uniref:type I-E CRISPR-associated protein Cas6/Cse3/CasE n=1 Tax=Streptomyces sp. TLI_053 TaxID=1855352 RepID=UPI0008795915|nr:type I-E CRISPR-associated protein Cas6/Cse3/CasE [Streptomyces sp. TLI_053]SDS49732.1 CRISPR-associated protein, Cse3 family [Streptomyces sp. TLI_053]